MAKSKAEINMFKEMMRLRKRVERDATEFYGSMAIVLKNRGMSQDDVIDLIVDVGCLWDEVVANDIDIVKRCFEETGIDIRDSITRTKGEENED